MNTTQHGAQQNPKAEIRRPKEGRNPKAGTESIESLSVLQSSFWTWGTEPSSEPLALYDGEPAAKRPFQDLQERTAQFGERIINCAEQIPANPVNSRLIAQLVGAGTSVGANYCEADDAVSGKEFKQKIGTCRKESKETMFFLRMIAKAEPALAEEARILWREAKELNLIFGAIWRK
jgi:four helix bundle protein